MNIEKELTNLIAQRLGISTNDLEDNHGFELDLNMGQSELLELISLIEDKFKITIEDEHLQTIKTVGDLKGLVLDSLGIIN